MDYTGIIDKKALEYAPKYVDSSLDAKVRSEIERLAFKAGINSPLAKQITEIDVVNGKIELLKEISTHPKYHGDKLADLEQLRDKLINELKLK